MDQGTTDDAGNPAAPYEAGPWRNYFLILLDRIPLPTAVCRADGVVLVANPAMAAEWGTAPGQLRGRNLLDLFRPTAIAQFERLTEALRLGRRSRYPVEVRWRAGTDGAERTGELTVDPVGDPSVTPPALLAVLRAGEEVPQPSARGLASPVEARILALAAAGTTTAAIGKSLGMTTDGVNYHLGRLARRWRVQGRTALVAKAYVLGVLSPTAWPRPPSERPARAPDAGPTRLVRPTRHSSYRSMNPPETTPGTGQGAE
ncbi:PAS domain-containing protein [Streptomyces sp. MST-110588]|uniref:PAS domain-containing protein n=1 Tax=Streptomyces sp. MST-110588 TaxID=2833628 RepID=UPI002065EFEC|nr:PAS domain-containing protein [Streptomyces sp. MST-110588]